MDPAGGWHAGPTERMWRAGLRFSPSLQFSSRRIHTDFHPEKELNRDDSCKAPNRKQHFSWHYLLIKKTVLTGDRRVRIPVFATCFTSSSAEFKWRQDAHKVQSFLFEKLDPGEKNLTTLVLLPKLIQPSAQTAHLKKSKSLTDLNHRSFLITNINMPYQHPYLSCGHPFGAQREDRWGCRWVIFGQLKVEHQWRQEAYIILSLCLSCNTEKYKFIRFFSKKSDVHGCMHAARPTFDNNSELCRELQAQLDLPPLCRLCPVELLLVIDTCQSKQFVLLSFLVARHLHSYYSNKSGQTLRREGRKCYRFNCENQMSQRRVALRLHVLAKS